ncbi:hypothetical protein C8J56DRAFT_902333 [Mycena floridula]|nr:hypothetical protein C8J56DRAFT_902333 [Mycena floridula]
MSSLPDSQLSSWVQPTSAFSLVDADADLTLPELHLRLHHYLCSFAGLYPRPPEDPEGVAAGHKDTVRLCLGTENNFDNVGRFFLYCINDDPSHINACCWDVFHGYLTAALPEDQLARLKEIRDEILRRPGGHWGQRADGDPFTAEGHLETAQIGARYLGNIGMYDFLPRRLGGILPVPSQKPPVGTSRLTVQQLEHRMQRCIEAFSSTRPRLPEWQSNGHIDELRLCNGKDHFRLQDAGRWFLECQRTSDPKHQCEGFHGCWQRSEKLSSKRAENGGLASPKLVDLTSWKWQAMGIFTALKSISTPIIDT